MANFLQAYRTLEFNKRLIGLDDREIRNQRVIQTYCTPRGAVMIGRLGYDGVHFCFIPKLHPDHILEDGRVYVVSPEVPDHAVEPVAENFLSFLSLIYCCKGTSLLEQVSHLYRGRRQFEELLYGPYSLLTPEKVTALEILERHFPLPEIVDPYAYITQLQSDFLMSKVPFSIEFSEYRKWTAFHDGQIAPSGYVGIKG